MHIKRLSSIKQFDCFTHMKTVLSSCFVYNFYKKIDLYWLYVLNHWIKKPYCETKFSTVVSSLNNETRPLLANTACTYECHIQQRCDKRTYLHFSWGIDVLFYFNLKSDNILVYPKVFLYKDSVCISSIQVCETRRCILSSTMKPSPLML